MNILITVSHSAELEPLLGKFGNCQPHEIGPIPVYRCTVGNVQVAILQTGIGVKKASQSLQTFLKTEADHFHPEVVINIGSAGALNPDYSIGDLVVGSSSIREPLSGGKRNLRSSWTQSLEKYLQNEKIEYVNGTILSVKKPMKSQAKKMEIFMKTRAEVVEMECDGLAEIAQEWEMPLLSVKCISDLAGEDVSNEYRLHLPMVTKRLSDLVYGYISSLTDTSR